MGWLLVTRLDDDFAGRGHSPQSVVASDRERGQLASDGRGHDRPARLNKAEGIVAIELVDSWVATLHSIEVNG